MANLIPFYELVVGKRYQMYSRYWMDVKEVEIISSDIWHGEAAYVKDGVTTDSRFCTDPVWDYFFEGYPTDDECRMAKKKAYVPPRKIKGVLYSGCGISPELSDILDNLIKNLNNTWDTKVEDEWTLEESEVDYEISELLVQENGKPDFEIISYIKDRGYEVRPAETDSFGWLIGIISKVGVPNKGIMFG